MTTYRYHYLRVSADDQSIESQRHVLGPVHDGEFIDAGVSGLIAAAERPAFADMLAKLRPGDTLAVTAVDRLGRDAIDIQTTVRDLIENRGVTVDIKGIGVIGRGVGEIIVSVLAQVADLDRRRIRERCDAGRAAARVALKATGKTHRGKASLGRPAAGNAAEVVAWRKRTKSSIAATAERFNMSVATVKRYCSAESKSPA